MQEYNFNKNDLGFLVRLRVRNFKIEENKHVTEKQIKDYLFNIKWKKRNRMSICEIVDDIMSVDFSEIYDYLSVQVVKDANKLTIQDFSDMISN